MQESKVFIEWTAQEAKIETTAVLVELQIQLVQWQSDLTHIRNDSSKRIQVAEQSKRWLERVLDMSGLLH